MTTTIEQLLCSRDPVRRSRFSEEAVEWAKKLR